MNVGVIVFITNLPGRSAESSTERDDKRRGKARANKDTDLTFPGQLHRAGMMAPAGLVRGVTAVTSFSGNHVVLKP
jgi:hypothetical protein